MSSLLRRHQQTLMIVITILTIIVFVGYWNGPTGNRNRMPQAPTDIGKIYGIPLTRTTVQHQEQMAKLALGLRLDLICTPDGQRSTGLAGRATTEIEAVNNFILNSIVFNHEADRLQIEPMSGEDLEKNEVVAAAVEEAIKNLPAFRPNGQFDPARESDFVSNDLPPLGLSPRDFEDLIAEDLRMKKIMELLHTTFVISPEEYRAWYTQRYQKMDVSVIHFNLADFAAKIQVSDDDVKKAFEQNLESYKSEEKRGIKFVAFALSDADKKLTGKERIAALQKLTDSVQQFTEALQENGAKFDEVAAKSKVPVTDAAPFAESAPDPKLPPDSAFLEAIFRLTPQSPDTDPVQDPETGSYYIAHLGQVVPSRQMTLAEARPQIVEQLQHSRAEEQIAAKAREVRDKIQADMGAGKSFADAAKAEAQTVETYPPFSFAEPDLDKEDAREVTLTAAEMKDGALSDFVPTEAGGILVYMNKREPIDPKKFETDRALYEPEFDKQHVDVVFAEWLRKQRDAANILLNGATKATPIPPPPK